TLLVGLEDSTHPTRQLCPNNLPSPLSREDRSVIAACRELVEKMRRHPRVALGLLVSLATALGVGGYVGGRQLWAWRHYRDAERALQKRPIQDLAGARQELDACLTVWPLSEEIPF